MKKIIMLAMVLMTMLVSLGGCCWPYPDHGRGDGHGDRHDRGEEHDHGNRPDFDMDGGHER